jgi:hypothetical protein
MYLFIEVAICLGILAAVYSACDVARREALVYPDDAFAVLVSMVSATLLCTALVASLSRYVY